MARCRWRRSTAAAGWGVRHTPSATAAGGGAGCWRTAHWRRRVVALAAVGVQQLVWQPDLSRRADDLRVAQVQTAPATPTATPGAGVAAGEGLESDTSEKLVQTESAGGFASRADGVDGTALREPSLVMPRIAKEAGERAEQQDVLDMLDAPDTLAAVSDEANEASLGIAMGGLGSPAAAGDGAGAPAEAAAAMPGWQRLLASLERDELDERKARRSRFADAAPTSFAAAAVELEVITPEPDAARGEVVRWAAANRAQVIQTVTLDDDAGDDTGSRREGYASTGLEETHERQLKGGREGGRVSDTADAPARKRSQGAASDYSPAGVQQLVVVVDRSQVDDLVQHLNANATDARQETRLQTLSRDQQRLVEEYTQQLALAGEVDNTLPPSAIRRNAPRLDAKAPAERERGPVEGKSGSVNEGLARVTGEAEADVAQQPSASTVAGEAAGDAEDYSRAPDLADDASSDRMPGDFDVEQRAAEASQQVEAQVEAAGQGQTSAGRDTAEVVRQAVDADVPTPPTPTPTAPAYAQADRDAGDARTGIATFRRTTPDLERDPADEAAPRPVRYDLILRNQLPLAPLADAAVERDAREAVQVTIRQAMPAIPEAEIDAAASQSEVEPNEPAD